MYRTCDIRLIIKTVFALRVADILYDISRDCDRIDFCLCCDFAHDMDSARLCYDLTGRTGCRIFCEKRIEDAICYLIADFIGMPVRY